MMKLWLISQTANDDYDTYDSAVVCAPSEGCAKRIHPGGGLAFAEKVDGYNHKAHSWTSDISHVDAVCIGEAAPGMKDGEVVCASFNAG